MKVSPRDGSLSSLRRLAANLTEPETAPDDLIAHQILARGWIPEDRLEQARSEQHRVSPPPPLLDLLLERKWLHPDQVNELLRAGQSQGSTGRRTPWKTDILLALLFTTIATITHAFVLMNPTPVPAVSEKDLVKELQTRVQDVDALRYRADTSPSQQQAQWKETRNRLLRTHRRFPKSVFLLHLLGISCSEVGSFELAEQYWRMALEISPTHSPSRILLARQHLLLTTQTLKDVEACSPPLPRLQEARQLLKDLPILHPSLRSYASALQSYAEGDYEEVRRMCRSWIDREGDNPGSEEFWHLLALTLPLEEQIPPLDHALRLCPGFTAALFARGTVHHRLGNPPEALRDYNRVLEFLPHYPPARMNRALLRKSEGDLSGARKDLDDLLHLLPPSSPDRPRVERLRDDLK